MSELAFLGLSGLLLATLLGWGCKYLPRERWQMLAVVPRRKNDNGSWLGTNLTFYGFFIATSQLLSIMLLLILLGSAGLDLPAALIAIAILLTACVPASKLIAIAVEKKRHTFTIGGASFVGILLAPWAILVAPLLTDTSQPLPAVPTLAALAISYTLGEGLGRLGCISFGCCYGKPLSQCSLVLQKLFRNGGVCFTGPVQKAVYEGKLSGQPLVPIQALTATIYTATALVGSAFFLYGRFLPALLIPLAASQGWRLLSETLRADFRGYARFSAYQKMGLAGLAYLIGVLYFLPSQPFERMPHLESGLRVLWDPAIILGLQGLWLFFFRFFGKSSITGAEVTISLHQERV